MPLYGNCLCERCCTFPCSCKTVVVNLRKEPCDVKVTRTRDNKVPDPPAEGCFGNPYPVKIYGWEECIALYRIYFLRRVKSDPAFRDAVLSLRGKRLGCLCKPDACHGDIIAEWLNSCNSNCAGQ